MISILKIKEDIEHHVKVLLMAVLFALVSSFITGCSIAKKDAAAVERVNAKASLQIPVVNAYLQAHPIDTTPRIILSEPKIVTVYNEKLVKDTTGKQRLIDSVKESHEKEIDCGKAATDAYDLGYDQAEQYYLSHPVKVTCPPDTTKTYFLTSEIRRWQDSSRLKTNGINYIKGKNDQLSEQNSKLWWILAASLVFTVLTHVVRSYIPKLSLPSFIKGK